MPPAFDEQDPLGLGAPDAGADAEGAQAPSVDVVASVGPLDTVVVTLREVLHRSGAIRAAALLAGERDGDPPSLVDCSRLAPIKVTTRGRTVQLPHALELDAQPLALYAMRILPPFEVHPDEGRIAAPLGGVEHYGFAVRSLADALGTDAVALMTFATTDAQAPLTLTARTGDPIVLSLGDEEYEMGPGWPDGPAHQPSPG